ncbi:hypothetical protein N8T08_007229 [Aspergillus melleus]|uniref:Uncharacterized protein n=1 Tax=Aspergillus melleus TaxID=138277 RepID=A0ACC3AYU9_9EURO|nr:hypothetical protein N8T08_007229 [Aspergillus melleus]
MSTVRFGPRDLLEYDAHYGVLICRECHYAIQKTALQSHLLRHKIYRSERQDLLCQIAPLQLLEPHEVPLPGAATSPIEALPIIPGYRCTSVGCGCLYASSKRMKRHQTETHGRGDTSDILSHARPATLQTFFRGTKLRYFEVTGQVPHDLDSSVDSPSLDVDLDTLACFHYFLTTASLTLPCPQRRGHLDEYWQTKVVPHALRNRWLMCGLLAISASHLAAEAGGVGSPEIHCNRSRQFFVEFSAGWDATNETTDLADEIREAASQVALTTVWGFAGTDLPLRLDNSPDIDLNCLQTLPSRMAGIFGMPDDVRDVLATLSAIAELVQCCENVLFSGEAAVLWGATTDWLSKVPDRFNDLTLRNDPAALVVVAHWAALLVRNVERSCCWFFHGLSTTIVREIVELIPSNDAKVRHFVENLID